MLYSPCHLRCARNASIEGSGSFRHGYVSSSFVGRLVHSCSYADANLSLQSVRGSVSLPRLHLISSSRPLFECPSCYSCNDRLPICLWCKSTTKESTIAFWESMPKQRTVSAPMKVTWTYMPMKSTIDAPGRTKSAEVRFFCLIAI